MNLSFLGWAGMQSVKSGVEGNGEEWSDGGRETRDESDAD